MRKAAKKILHEGSAKGKQINSERGERAIHHVYSHNMKSACTALEQQFFFCYRATALAKQASKQAIQAVSRT